MKLTEIMQEARVSYDNGHYSKAIHYYQEALKFKLPSSMTMPLKIELAINYKHNKDYKLAIKTLTSLLPIDTSVENNYYIFSTLADSSYKLKDIANAQLYYDKAFKYSENYGERAEFLLMSAKCLFFLKRYAETEKKLLSSNKYKKHFSKKDKFTFYYYNSITKLELKKSDEAQEYVKHIKDYCKSDEEWAMYYYALSIFNFTLKNYDRLHSILEIAMKYEWNKKYHEEELLYYLGKYYTEAKMESEFNKIKDRILKDFPRSNYLNELDTI